MPLSIWRVWVPRPLLHLVSEVIILSDSEISSLFHVGHILNAEFDYNCSKQTIIHLFNIP